MRGFTAQYSRADIVVRGMEAGLSPQQIADVLGISRPALDAWRRNACKRLKQHKCCSPRMNEMAFALQLLDVGLSVMEVVRLTGCKQAAITNARRRAGIPSRCKPENHAGIVRDLRSGMSAKEVGEKYGVTTQSVYTLAHLYGRPLTDEERSARRGRKGLKGK